MPTAVVKSVYMIGGEYSFQIDAHDCNGVNLGLLLQAPECALDTVRAATRSVSKATVLHCTCTCACLIKLGLSGLCSVTQAILGAGRGL